MMIEMIREKDALKKECRIGGKLTKTIVVGSKPTAHYGITPIGYIDVHGVSDYFPKCVGGGCMQWAWDKSPALLGRCTAKVK